jgi:hypothetical protein
VGLAALAIVIAAAVGVGAYLLGRTGGQDLAAARAKGHKEGISLGYAAGIHRGYSRGFSASRQLTYQQAYRRAYVAAYRRAFRRLGIAVPDHVAVPSSP